MKTSNKIEIYASFGILFLYMGIRYLIYKFFVIETEDDWLIRDVVMDIPRILCFFIVIKFLDAERRKDFYSMHLPSRSLLLGLTLLILIRPIMSIFFDTDSMSLKYILISGFSSVFVALFEEALFRGLLFDSLKSLVGTGKAIFASALVFMVFHIQAQGFEFFPLLFLYGVLFATLRAKGCPLIWLVILHAVIDVLVTIWVPKEFDIWIVKETFILGLLAIAFLLNLFSFSQKNKLS